MYYSIMGLSSPNPFENEFYIQERESLNGYEYIYPGYGILYDIDSSLNDMYDLMLAYVFGDTTSYYDLVMNLPMICDVAGYSPETQISNDNLNAVIQLMGKNSIFGREMLLTDLQFLIGSINNLVSSLSFDFINFYMYLSFTHPTTWNGSTQRLAFGKYFSTHVSIHFAPSPATTSMAARSSSLSS